MNLERLNPVELRKRLDKEEEAVTQELDRRKNNLRGALIPQWEKNIRNDHSIFWSSAQ